MAAFDPATLDRWRALAIVDRDGTTVGTVSEFYLDRETGHPTWALVNIGLFGATRTFVPLVHAIEIGDGLQVPYEKRHIKDSPHIDPHDQLTPDEEAILFTHYGVEYRPSTDPEPGVARSPGAGPGATGSVESTGAVAPEAGSAGPTEAVPAEPTEVVDPSGGAPGSGKPTEATPADPEPADLTGGAPDPDQPPGAAQADPEPADLAGDLPDPDQPPGAAPADPGTTGRVGMPGAEAGQVGPVYERFDEEPPRPHPDLSHPVAVEPGRPGSTAATPSGPTPTTIDAGDPTQPIHGVEGGTGSPPPDPESYRWPSATPERGAGDPDPYSAGPGPVPATDDAARPAWLTPDPTTEPPATHQEEDPGRTASPAAWLAEDRPRAPGEARWAPGESGWAPGAVEEREPAGHPAGASDRWREAKLAAERERIARAAAVQPEGRSPLGRARRRLERLVSGGQAPDDPAEVSPADLDAAERARRERLGLDEDDPQP